MKTFNFRFSWILLIVVFSFLVSCRATRQVTRSEQTNTNRTEKKTSYKDTLFHTASAKVDLALPLSALKKCPETYHLNGFETAFKSEINNGQSTREKPKIWRQKNGNATALVKVIHDSIYITAQCDSLTLAAKIKREFFATYKNQTNSKEISETKKASIWGRIMKFVYGFIIGVIIGLITRFFILRIIKF